VFFFPSFARSFGLGKNSRNELKLSEFKKILTNRCPPCHCNKNKKTNNRNAWSKSRLLQGAARRSEEILERMISLGKERPELRPDTTSFNTVLDTLAKSLEYDREQRAEALLERMETLSENDPSMNCRPNEVVSSILMYESCVFDVIHPICFRFVLTTSVSYRGPLQSHSILSSIVGHKVDKREQHVGRQQFYGI